jgi:hypothetical protein
MIELEHWQSSSAPSPLGGEGWGEGALPNAPYSTQGPLTRRYAPTSPPRER